ncbi:MAG: metallophosphoesterase [Candidatus Omnitrophica bacterium]|nr:metallophosphoesterase [Candidatus Omnitrophota bacterium]
MMNFRLILILSFMLSVAGTAFADSERLTIVFSGDMRGEIENCHCPKDDFGGLARRSKYIAEVREEAGDILLIDTGDVLPLFTPEYSRKKILYNAFVSFKAMEMMGYDVMNAGESDLILGEKFLKEKGKNLSFSVISANIVEAENNKDFFRPYLIKKMKNGLRVGVLGVVNERYIINSKRLDILPNKEAVSGLLPELRDKADIIIVLGHLGLPYSIELAESIEGIDVILSGHWDAGSQEPIKIGNTLVMSTSYHSRKIGRLDLEIDGGEVHSYKWESTPLDYKYDGKGIINSLVSKMPDLEAKAQPEPKDPLVEQIAQERPLKVFVFYSPSCRSCMEIDRDLLPGIREKYSDKIVLGHYDVSIQENYEQMLRLEKMYGLEEEGGYVPEVIVSGYILTGEKDIVSKLDKVIQKALSRQIDVKKNEDIPLEAVEYQLPSTGSLILSKFQSFSVYTVLIAGLLDGVNPCAFTTIVFFISFLAFAGYRKREMLFASLSFTTAVFIAYLLIGLGIFRFLNSLRGFAYIADSVNIIILSLAILLGVLSLIDYFKFKSTKDTKSIILKLPQFIKNKIHTVIGSDFRTGTKHEKGAILRIIWIALVSGFVVSVLESVCTGQVYLPTIAFVLRMPEEKISALSYLIIYNLAFILPLVAVVVLGLFGVTSNAFSRFMEKRLGMVKLATAALFFLLGSLLIMFR